MRTATLLADTEDFAVRAVACTGGQRHWSAPEAGRGYGMVLVRRGLFRLRHRGRQTLAEPTTGYVQAPGAEFQFAHPAGGDTCTSLHLSDELWHAAGPTPQAGPVPVDGRVELAHLLLLRAAREPDLSYAVVERLVTVLAEAARAAAGSGTTEKIAPSPASRRAAASLTTAAREAILTGDPCAHGLAPLAAALGVSPFHLSRTFRAHAGLSLTRYRNRVRVSRALHLLDQGESDLARVAADLGFADQAHLTRTVKAEVGQPPAALRRLLDV